MNNISIHNVQEVMLTTRRLSGDLGQSTTLETTTLCPHCQKKIKEDITLFSDDKIINGEGVNKDEN